MPKIELVGPQLVRKPNVQEIWLSSTNLLALLKKKTRVKTTSVNEHILIG